MKEYTTQFIRNVVLVSHSSAGKTMLAEAMLHFTGVTTRLGRIEDGSTVSDFEDEEIRRGISLSTSVIPVEYKDCKINFLDTPGYGDVAADFMLKKYGVKSQNERAWRAKSLSGSPLDPTKYRPVYH